MPPRWINGINGLPGRYVSDDSPSDRDILVRKLEIRDLQRQQIACLRILLAITEQEKDDATADAAALKANRDLLEVEFRAERLSHNETRTLLNAAKSVGIEQEGEIMALQAALTAAHAELRLARDPWAEREPMRAVKNTLPIWREDA